MADLGACGAACVCASTSTIAVVVRVVALLVQVVAAIVRRVAAPVRRVEGNLKKKEEEKERKREEKKAQGRGQGKAVHMGRASACFTPSRLGFLWAIEISATGSSGN